MKLKLRSCLLVGIAVALVFNAFVCWLTGAWIPDVIFPHWDIVKVDAVKGGRFRIKQRWNGDFYSTILEINRGHSQVDAFLVDPDADKLWSWQVKVAFEESTINVSDISEINVSSPIPTITYYGLHVYVLPKTSL